MTKPYLQDHEMLLEVWGISGHKYAQAAWDVLLHQAYLTAWALFVSGAVLSLVPIVLMLTCLYISYDKHRFNSRLSHHNDGEMYVTCWIVSIAIGCASGYLLYASYTHFYFPEIHALSKVLGGCG